MLQTNRTVLINGDRYYNAREIIRRWLCSGRISLLLESYLKTVPSYLSISYGKIQKLGRRINKFPFALSFYIVEQFAIMITTKNDRNCCSIQLVSIATSDDETHIRA